MHHREYDKGTVQKDIEGSTDYFTLLINQDIPARYSTNAKAIQ